MSKVAWFMVLLVMVTVSAGSKYPWDYDGTHGPSHWGWHYPTCSSHKPRQSPIDIQRHHAIFNRHLDPIKLHNRFWVNYNYTMKNNGHSVNIDVTRNNIAVEGVYDTGSYRVAGVHFHWGSDDHHGSEHSINGEKYPLEMHVVTYKDSRYWNLKHALTGHNSLLVLGTLFELSRRDNPELEHIIRHLHEVQLPETEIRLPYIPIRNLLPYHLCDYYHYYGSLTTPPCTENVVWVVFSERQTISLRQLEQFRQLYKSHSIHDKLTHNWRPLQPLHGRTVYKSFPYTTHCSRSRSSFDDALFSRFRQ